MNTTTLASVKRQSPSTRALPVLLAMEDDAETGREVREVLERHRMHTATRS